MPVARARRVRARRRRTAYGAVGYTDYRTDLAGARVTGYGPFPYQVDGDYLGETTELRFRHEPDVMDLVMP